MQLLIPGIEALRPGSGRPSQHIHNRGCIPREIKQRLEFNSGNCVVEVPWMGRISIAQLFYSSESLIVLEFCPSLDGFREQILASPGFNFGANCAIFHKLYRSTDVEPSIAGMIINATHEKDEARNQRISNRDSGVARTNCQQRFAYFTLILKFQSLDDLPNFNHVGKPNICDVADRPCANARLGPLDLKSIAR
jgi:hypothetical protein